MTAPQLPSWRRLSTALAPVWPGSGRVTGRRLAAWRRLIGRRLIGRRLISRRLAGRAWLVRVAWLFTVTRLGILAAAYLGWLLFPQSNDPAPYHLRGVDNVLVDVFGSRWDTGFYVSIVEEGYVYEGVPFPSAAFFPLLPLLMRLLLPLTGDAVLAGLLVTNAALLGAALLFYRLVADEWGDKIAGRAVWYLLIFPTSFFGSAIYTEALFLVCALGAWYAARRGRWWLAGLLGIACSATRLVGVIIVPLLLVEWLRARRLIVPRWTRADADIEAPRPPLLTGLAPLAAPLGVLGYMTYLWLRFGDFLGFVTASAAWARTPQPPSETIAALLARPAGGWLSALAAGHIHINDWIDFLFILLFLALGFILLWEHRWGQGLFVWLGVMIPFSSGLLMSQRRYMWILFPAFILLARWGERPGVDRAITALSWLGLVLFTALFANGYWVA